MQTDTWKPGDKVTVVAGKHKGDSGEVVRAIHNRWADGMVMLVAKEDSSTYWVKAELLEKLVLAPAKVMDGAMSKAELVNALRDMQILLATLLAHAA
jgi:uncharacterized protein YaaW (UPF0174 family)